MIFANSRFSPFGSDYVAPTAGGIARREIGDAHWASIIVSVVVRGGQQVFTHLNTSKEFALILAFLLVSSFAVEHPFDPTAGVAQLVEQLICNHQVVSSSLITGSSKYKGVSVSG